MKHCALVHLALYNQGLQVPESSSMGLPVSCWVTNDAGIVMRTEVRGL